MDNNEIKKYEDYFKDDLEILDKELDKSNKFYNIIEKEIDKFTTPSDATASRGGQHYLIEHIKNAVALQSQKQSLLKDRVALKKIIMDYTVKNSKDDDGSLDLQKELIRFSKMYSPTTDTEIDDTEADSIIDSIVGNNEDNKDN